ncbi:hypothetical protein B0T09DRAFT_2588 [Sordaria sp. MPI-SDFR-AT-0083]|nr:hypothetical protein B0T09DRAFT_2588 [Sordaria sp. MPI-SDFR-AT-0083]
MSRNRYYARYQGTSRPPYISFSHDWDANRPFTEQAPLLIGACIRSTGTRVVPALLREQRESRRASPVGTMMYLFHNAIVCELERTFGMDGCRPYKPHSML